MEDLNLPVAKFLMMTDDDAGTGVGARDSHFIQVMGTPCRTLKCQSPIYPVALLG